MRSDSRTRAEKTGEIYGQIAFTLAVVSSLAQLAFQRRIDGAPWQIAVTFGGGALYGCLGVLSGPWVDTGARAKAAYFVLQVTLASLVILSSPSRGFLGIIALPIAAQSIFDLRWPLALGVNLGLFAVCVASIWLPYGADSGLQAAVAFSPAFVFTAVFSLLTKRAFDARQDAERLTEQLAEANTRLREQSAQTEELAISRERNRLAREIHDGLGHYLTVIHVQLEAARTTLASAPDQAAGALAKAERLAREALDEVRRSVADLHREAAPMPLVQRIQGLCEQCQPAARCTVHGAPRRLGASTEHTLFRAAQEALTNARKHAGDGASVLVELFYDDPGRTRLRVTDDGPGPSGPPPATAGFGLRAMRERVELLAGRLQVGARPEGGFELEVELPA